MVFPREVIEKILYYCDGKTLKKAENVHADWKDVVQYLAKNYNIWKHCCHEDIPKSELLQYKAKWIESNHTEQINWEQLYENWISWHNIKENINFQMGTMWKLNRISCINVYGDCVAIGLTTGSVKIFDKDGNCLRTYRHLMVQVQSIHFVPEKSDNEPPTEMLIVYPNQVHIYDLRDIYAPGIIQNCYIFSTYNHFICGVSQVGHITIGRLSNDDVNRKKAYETVTYARIYSPETVKSCSLFEGICMILVNDKVKIINYMEGSKSSNFMAVELTALQFSTRESFALRRDITIYHNKVIITVTKSVDTMQQQLFELFILNDEEKRNSKKMFMPWKIFNAFITCVYLYGNTFVIGLSTGFVHFYEIHDWKLFDIAKYSGTINVTDFVPVISIDAVECAGERIFYISSSTFICKVIGKTVTALS